MDFRIADTFTDALARLPAQEQKAAKLSVMDLQLDPGAPGLQMHRIDKSRDEHFWSARVSRDLRLILHRTPAAVLVAYVDHHDRAYAWAERRRIEAHPTTGVVQIVEVRERVEEAEPERARLWAPADELAEAPAAPAPLFVRLTEAELLSVGVPADWIAPVQRATEDGFYELAEHLPAEAAEALLDFATTGVLPAQLEPLVAEAAAADPFAHPDARRRFLTIESSEALEAALEAPWERWSVFLHPSQQALVERVFNGPARAAGTAGTGKTVVALHRAAGIVRADPGARLLLATFSEPLAANLTAKLGVLVGASAVRPPQLTVAAFEAAAHDLFLLAFGRRPRIANDDQVSRALADAAAETGASGAFSQRFLEAEWAAVIDAWRVRHAEAYATVPRLGRRNRLGARQRQALWPVFASARARLEAQGLATWAGVFHDLADHYGDREAKPFTHAIVDEAQDLGVAELRMMAAITPSGADRLFFAGDLGQRIFQQPFSWMAVGVDVRGRSTTLKVNYRTSQQIRAAADRLLPDLVRDADGLEEDRRGAISVFEGPAPAVVLARDQADETEQVAGFLRACAADGIGPGQIGVFVRSRRELPRARAAVERAGLSAVELSERGGDQGERVAIGTMHLAKGLEFRAVAVMACDDEVLPLAERIDAVVEESDLDDVYDTERHLLYVACTRARDRLLVSGVRPGSEFLLDLGRHSGTRQ